MVRDPPGYLVSHRHICAVPHFATYRAIIVRYPIKTSTKEFCNTIRYNLQFPNAVVLNAVGRRNTQMLLSHFWDKNLGHFNSFSVSVELGERPLHNTIFRNTLSTAWNSMTSSERPSPEPFLAKEASPALLRGREFWKCSGSLKCLEL